MTPWTVAHQAPLSMGFPRQEYWSGLPFPSPRDFPDLMYFLFWAVLGLCCCPGCSLVAESGGTPLHQVAMLRLLILVAPLVVGRGSCGCGSWAREHRLSSCVCATRV